MDSFHTIIQEADVQQLIKHSDRYLAHTPDEKLGEHMLLVTYYFERLLDVHRLEPVIDDLLLKLGKGSLDTANLAKKQFWQTILYHDFGKVNENFQQMKMDNAIEFPETKTNGIETQHSILSAFVFLIHQLSRQDIPSGLIPYVAYLGHNIIRHHSSRLDNLSAHETFARFSTRTCKDLIGYLDCFDVTCEKALVENLPKLTHSRLHPNNLSFEWFALIRLNFSLLTAADYYATSHYCDQWSTHYDAFGVLNKEQRNRHFANLKLTQSHNKALYQRLNDNASERLDYLQEKSPENLNKLRSTMAKEVIENVRQHAYKRLFYIEAPTGGGKTNMAFIATQELLQANSELNKVFYVFPFTTLATQTQKAAENSLGLEADEWIELHSRAPWKQKERLEDDEDGLYGHDRLDDIHNQFVNYPYTFLSHVRFFDILKANSKSSIYLMHRLANSVVVIDEVQAYNPELWDKMAYLLKEYAEALNIRFIVMSATLPKIGNLVDADFCYLLPNAISRYFVNPNFAGRVIFSDELLKRKRPKKEEREEYLDWLLDEVHKKSEDYRNKHGQVRTIIEFIFKKSASEFANLTKEVFKDYEIHVLSGTILEPKRKEIVRRLKDEANQNKNVLLITTQVVEAGVDIDMDLGFKNRSMIDSEEQLAGRVNRNVRKEDCTVYLFDLDDASVIYGKDLRYKEIRKTLEKEYFEILESKNFDKLYNKVKEWLDKTNKESNLKGTAHEYKNLLIGSLNFPKVDSEFVLIEHSNTSVFVPLVLPLNAFTEQQIQFLERFEVVPSKDEMPGERVFDLYKELIQDQESSFGEKKRNLKILQSIMAMYVFSLFSESNLLKELTNGGNREEYGYLYLVCHQDVYEYEKGLLDQKFTAMQFL